MLIWELCVFEISKHKIFWFLIGKFWKWSKEFIDFVIEIHTETYKTL